MTKDNGFTLPDLMTALSVMAVISVLAFPSLETLLDSNRSRNAVYALFHHLQFARASAINKNRVVTLCPSLDGKTCNKSRDWSGQTILVFIDDDGSGTLENKDMLLKSLDFSAHPGTLKWRSFGNKSYLQWFPHGMTHYQNGNFTYCPEDNNAQHASRITLNAVGRAYFASDQNDDGIVEGSDGENIQCEG